MARSIKEIEAELREAQKAQDEADTWVQETWEAQRTAEWQLRAATEELDRASTESEALERRVFALMAELRMAKELYEEEV